MEWSDSKGADPIRDIQFAVENQKKLARRGNWLYAVNLARSEALKKLYKARAESGELERMQRIHRDDLDAYEQVHLWDEHGPLTMMNRFAPHLFLEPARIPLLLARMLGAEITKHEEQAGFVITTYRATIRTGAVLPPKPEGL